MARVKLEKLESWKNKGDIRFSEVEKVLSSWGFKLEKSKGSHFYYKHDKLKEHELLNSNGIIVIPVKGGQKVIKPYLQKILKLLQEIDAMENQQGEKSWKKTLNII